MGRTSAARKTRPGFDFIHSAVDDHSRVAYSEIHPDEKGDTCAGFMARAAAWFADHRVRIEAVMTDNHFSYVNSRAFAGVLEAVGADHVTIRPHCPWQNGKVERFNRTLQAEWAYRQVFTSNEERSQALPAWLDDYNYTRRHSSLAGNPPASRLTPT